MTTPRWLDQRFADRPDSGAKGLNPAAAYRVWRVAKLYETVGWAAGRSPFFRRLLEPRTAARALRGLDKAARSGDLGAAEDILAELPFCFPAQLAAEAGLFLAVGHDEVEGIVSVPSSGTSGAVKRIFSTAADLEETVVFFQYGMRFMVDPGQDRVALAMSPARPGNVGDLLGRAMERLGLPFLAQGFPPPAGRDEAWLKELVDWRPTCLVGVPAHMLALARHPLAAELSRGLKTMLLSGDVADDDLVAELEKNLPGCRVYRHYGSTETGLGGAVECRQRLWPHPRDDLWLEIVDEKGRRVPASPGEIVITPLTRRAMPLLRYRSGDEGEILTDTCPCGSFLPRLKVYGRLADRLTLPGGRILRASDFEAPLLALPFVRDYRPAYAPGPRPLLRLTLVPGPDYPAEAARLGLERVRAWLGSDGAGLSIEVRLESPRQSAAEEKTPGGKRRLERLSDQDASSPGPAPALTISSGRQT